MKKLFSLLFSLCISYSFAQERMFVGIHYVTVKNEDAQAHIDSEKKYLDLIIIYWSIIISILMRFFLA